MKYVRKFLSKLTIAVVALFLATPVHAGLITKGLIALGAAEILGITDIGDYGDWATENNREILIGNTQADFEHFATNTKMVDDYVPIEAKFGLAFMNAFSHIANILHKSLIPFIIGFIGLAFIIWTMFEAYMIITARKPTQETFVEIFKRGGITAIWILVLTENPAKLFVYAMTPILQVGTMITDGLLNATANIINYSLPDTCASIKTYVADNIVNNNLLDQVSAAEIMCLPTRLSAFCQTGVAAGWEWMWASLGDSVFGFLCGLAFVCGFLYMGWKFAFMAFGIIADLFIALIMLPFTAVTESVGKVSFPGIAGNIYNAFIGLFKSESLQAQIMRFINAALYFLVMSVIIAICASLMSTFDESTFTEIPDMDSASTWIKITSAALCWWLASNADKIAQEFGGAIDTSLGNELKSTTQTLASGSWNYAKGKWKAWRKK